MHSLDKESGLITLKVDKNRHGASRTITIRADFEEGKFEVTDSPYITQRIDDLTKLAQIIEASPGINVNAILKRSGMKTSKVLTLLREGTGTRWRTEPGPKRSICYFPVFPDSVSRDPSGNTQPAESKGNGSVFPHFPHIESVKRETLTEHLCAVHRFHSDWIDQDGVMVCLRCNPNEFELLQ